MKNKFSKAPLSKKDKEKKAEEFIGFLDSSEDKNKKLEKEERKQFLIYIPLSLLNDLRELSRITGDSMNAICRNLLKDWVKKKMKEIKESD